jgi:hypothetical protein
MTTNDNRMMVFSRAKISLGKDKDIHLIIFGVQTENSTF